MEYGIGDKREDFLSNLTACHGTAPGISSGPIESPKQPRVEATRAQVSSGVPVSDLPGSLSISRRAIYGIQLIQVRCLWSTIPMYTGMV